MKTKLKVGFIHPDLGIGGAERLVVDAATLLKHKLGYDVHFYTSFHDPNHSFKETNDGTLPVTVVGKFLPRSILGGRFHVWLAMMKSWLLALYLVWKQVNVDVFFVDQVSVSVPLLRLLGKPILFYCHFPDKLLSQRASLLKSAYRWPVDLLEEVSMGMADGIVVNSRFTGDVFQTHFERLQRYRPPVLYPCIQLSAYDTTVDLGDPAVARIVASAETATVLSINRFERKKNIALAVLAFAKFKLHADKSRGYRLVVAGGYDVRVLENVQYHKELVSLCKRLDLTQITVTSITQVSEQVENTADTAQSADVVFVLSFSENQRAYLLQNSSVLLYTPENEHFGIVPIEAMYAGLAVIAVNSGGPTETVLDGVTGYLCEQSDSSFCQAMEKVFSADNLSIMASSAKQHVIEKFGDDAFVSKLDTILRLLCETRYLPSDGAQHQKLQIRMTISDKLIMACLVLLLSILASKFLYSRM